MYSGVFHMFLLRRLMGGEQQPPKPTKLLDLGRLYVTMKNAERGKRDPNSVAILKGLTDEEWASCFKDAESKEESGESKESKETVDSLTTLLKTRVIFELAFRQNLEHNLKNVPNAWLRDKVKNMRALLFLIESPVYNFEYQRSILGILGTEHLLSMIRSEFATTSFTPSDPVLPKLSMWTQSEDGTFQAQKQNNKKMNRELFQFKLLLIALHYDVIPDVVASLVNSAFIAEIAATPMLFVMANPQQPALDSVKFGRLILNLPKITLSPETSFNEFFSILSYMKNENDRAIFIAKLGRPLNEVLSPYFGNLQEVDQQVHFVWLLNALPKASRLELLTAFQDLLPPLEKRSVELQNILVKDDFLVEERKKEAKQNVVKKQIQFFRFAQGDRSLPVQVTGQVIDDLNLVEQARATVVSKEMHRLVEERKHIADLKLDQTMREAKEVGFEEYKKIVGKLKKIDPRLTTLFLQKNGGLNCGLIALGYKQHGPFNLPLFSINVVEALALALQAGLILELSREKEVKDVTTYNVLSFILTKNGLIALKANPPLVKMEDVLAFARDRRSSLPQLLESILSDNGLVALSNNLISLEKIKKLTDRSKKYFMDQSQLIMFLHLFLSDYGLIALRDSLITLDQGFELVKALGFDVLELLLSKNGIIALQRGNISIKEILAQVKPEDPDEVRIKMCEDIINSIEEKVKAIGQERRLPPPPDRSAPPI